MNNAHQTRLLFVMLPILTFHFLLFQHPAFSAPRQPADLRCEFLRDPLGIDVLQPRLSWIMISGSRGELQTAYQVLVASSEARLNSENADMWDSRKQKSDRSIHVIYEGRPLESHMECYWKVRIWDKDGKVSGWSKTAKWTMGLIRADEWKARWIGRDEIDKTYHLTGTYWIWYPEGDPKSAVPVETRYFRRKLDLPEGKPIQKAYCYITGDNELTLFVNGKALLKKADHSVVAELDITTELRAGINIIAASVRNEGDKPNPAGFVGLFRVTLTDGSSITLQTDSLWKSMNRELTGWESDRFSDADWLPASVIGPAGISPWGEMYGFVDRRLPARWLRKEFNVEKNIRRAALYVCGLGLSEIYINGKKIGDHVLSPALSEYPKRVYYVTHDATQQLGQGVNALGAVLGNGRFFAPRLRKPTSTTTYGYPKLFLQLHIEFSDGTSKDIASDESWKLTTEGPIIANNEFDGEEYDARMELGKWSEAGYDDSRWQGAQIVDRPGGEIHSHISVPIRVTDTIKPIAVTETRPGIFIFDIGQNMVGWCRLQVSGPRDTKIVMKHAEILNPDGTLNTDNLRSAKATDTYILKGGGKEIFEPRFTYHGFRFVEIQGYPGRPDISALEGCVVNDDVESSGEFVCSNPVINRTYKNILWGVRGNYRSIPTDCPQRDERQGWLGDRSSESKGETYIFNIASLYSKWILDMADAQDERGSISDVCPAYWPLYNDNVTWPSSAVIIPGALFDQYADSALIKRHYPVMLKWINHMSKYIGDSIITRDSYGDWCVPPEDPKLIHTNDPARKTAPGILSTSYFYYDLKLMSRYAAFLELPEDVNRFELLAETLKNELNRRFYNKENGWYDNGSQTSCVLPLAFGIVPEGEQQKVFDHLVNKITNETKNHVGTGLVGGQFLNRVLTDFGRSDIVYKLATNITYPSWGYMAEKGATTIWELWNGDSGDPAMNSGNHVMLVGDLVIWLYEYLAGISPDPVRPGFKHILMRPVTAGDLTFVKASHNSPYGLISSHWRRENNHFSWDIQIPPNTRATLFVPSEKGNNITEGGINAVDSEGLKIIKWENGYTVFNAESGKYSFQSLLPVE